MATKPTTYLNWCTDGSPAKIVPPDPVLADSGYVPNQAPYPRNFNYILYLLDQWVQWLDQNSAAASNNVNNNANLRLINGGLWGFNLTTSTLSWTSAFNIAALGVADSANQAAAGSVTIADGAIAYVSANIPFTTTGDTTSGSATVNNIAYPIGIAVGQAVTGTGIPGGTVVLAISGTTLTLSDNATATGTGVSLTFVSSGALTVQTAATASALPSPTTVVIARRVGNEVYIGVGAAQMTLRDGEAKYLLWPGFQATSTVTAGVALSARTPVYISQGGSDAVTLSTATTSGSPTVTVADTSDVQVGNGVTGAGIPVGTTISAIVNGTTLTLSANATATATGVSVLYARTVGKAYPIDAGITYGGQRSAFIGITAAAIAQDASGLVVSNGTINGFVGLTAGVLYYADPATPGALTTTRPTTTNQYVVPIGSALSSTTLVINAALSVTSQIVQQTAVPGATYGVTTTAQLQSAITSAQSSGGTIMVTQAFTLTSSVTLPPNVVLMGQKAATSITLASNVGLTLSDYAGVRDVSFIMQAGVTTPAITASNNYGIVRECMFQLPTTGATGILCTGVGNRFYNNLISGVMGPSATSVGIAYSGGSDNLGDSNIFTA